MIRDKFEKLIILTDRVIKKTFNAMNEALAIEYVQKNTSILVPDIIYYSDEIIITKRIIGNSLEDVWEDLDYNLQNDILNQINKVYLQLYDCEEDFIGSFDKNIIHRDTGFISGTCKTLSSYINKLREENNMSLIETNINCKYKLSHGDLESRNIILDNENNIWIIDWEYAGFYPEGSSDVIPEFLIEDERAESIFKGIPSADMDIVKLCNKAKFCSKNE